jgi:hypothetical protein
MSKKVNLITRLDDDCVMRSPCLTKRPTHYPYEVGQSCGLLTLPYLACQAKKYMSAASGWPTRQKETQNMTLPRVFPVPPFILASGSVKKINGSWNIIPAKATPALD